IAHEVPALDVAISTDNAGPNVTGDATGPASREDPSGFHRSLLCLYTSPLNYGLVTADLGLDDSLHVAAVDFEVHLLTPDVPDDPGVRATLDRFYDAIGRTEVASIPPPFAHDRERMEGDYVGAD